MHEIVPVQGGRGVWCERPNGAKHGPFAEYRADGSAWKKGEYVNNRLMGTVTWWHANGQMAERCDYDQGFRNGERTVWDEHGAVVSREKYADDELVTE